MSRNIFSRSVSFEGDSTDVTGSWPSCCCPTFPSASSHAMRKIRCKRLNSTLRSSNSAGSFNISLKKSPIWDRSFFITSRAQDASRAFNSATSPPIRAADSATVPAYSSSSKVALRTTVGVNLRCIPMRIRSGRLCASSTITMMFERSNSIALSDASLTASTKR